MWVAGAVERQQRVCGDLGNGRGSGRQGTPVGIAGNPNVGKFGSNYPFEVLSLGKFKYRRDVIVCSGFFSNHIGGTCSSPQIFN